MVAPAHQVKDLLGEMVLYQHHGMVLVAVALVALEQIMDQIQEELEALALRPILHGGRQQAQGKILAAPELIIMLAAVAEHRKVERVALAGMAAAVTATNQGAEVIQGR
jgi:hypothetical protein